MTEPFTVTACEPNGHAVHPPRPVCPRCGATHWRRVLADRGALEELTARRAIAHPRRLPGGEWIDQAEAVLARVRTDVAPVVICRVVVDAVPGRVAEDTVPGRVTEDAVPGRSAPGAAPRSPGAPTPTRVRLRTRVLECGSRVVEGVPEDAP